MKNKIIFPKYCGIGKIKREVVQKVLGSAPFSLQFRSGDSSGIFYPHLIIEKKEVHPRSMNNLEIAIKSAIEGWYPESYFFVRDDGAEDEGSDNLIVLSENGEWYCHESFGSTVLNGIYRWKKEGRKATNRSYSFGLNIPFLWLKKRN